MCRYLCHQATQRPCRTNNSTIRSFSSLIICIVNILLAVVSLYLLLWICTCECDYVREGGRRRDRRQQEGQHPAYPVAQSHGHPRAGRPERRGWRRLLIHSTRFEERSCEDDFPARFCPASASAPWVLLLTLPGPAEAPPWKVKPPLADHSLAEKNTFLTANPSSD